jgi:AcrR family transcriptional regulator
MGRWGPDARGPLEQAAIDLCLERGFEQITVAEIAQRAGFSERTFYRHFADKPEVLFGGMGYLRDHVVSLVTGAPASATPMEAVVTAFEQAGSDLQVNAERLRQRQDAINATPELQARELTKLAHISEAITHALRQRGTSEHSAVMAAEAGTLVFRVTYGRWIAHPGRHGWTALFHETLQDAGTVFSGVSPLTPHP